MHPIHRSVLLSALMALCLFLVAGCKSQGESTRLRGSDFDATIQAMADSLAKSAFLADRPADAPALYIMVDKVENETDDLIPESEEWMLMARVEDAPPMRQLSQRTNIHFLLPPQRGAALRDAGYQGEIHSGTNATHVMMAIFQSARRAGTNKQSYAKGGEEYYYLEYKIADIQTRQTLWSDKFEFKRQAKGITIE